MNIINKLFLRGVHRDVAAENDELRAMLTVAYEDNHDLRRVNVVLLGRIGTLHAEVQETKAALHALEMRRLRVENGEFNAQYFVLS